jgi:uncharacterized protein YndB with AHSA1/START domain
MIKVKLMTAETKSILPPRAANDLRINGKFEYRKEVRDGSFGFDFTGTYTTIVEHQQIEYTIEDGIKVQVFFLKLGKETIVTEIFEAEQTHPVEMQRAG